MRVVITTDSVGGVWDHTLALGRALARSGHEAVLAHFGPPPSPTHVQQARSARLRLEAAPYPLEWMPGGIAQAPQARGWLRQLAQRVGAHAVHCNSYTHVDEASPLPQVLVAHSTLHGWWEAVRGTSPPAEWEPYRDAVAHALQAAHRVAAVGHELARHYARVSVEPVPNGIETPPARRAVRKSSVLAGGRLWDEGKGHRVLDAAAARLQWPVLATGSTQGPSGRATFRNLRTLGYLAPDLLDVAYREAGLYANPALYEAFGLGALEAAARGAPLLVSDLPSQREVWGDAAAYAPPGDVDSWRDALHRLVEDPDRRARLGAAARRQAGRYTATAMADAYLSLYASVVPQVHA